jgi:hypothetical protein
VFRMFVFVARVPLGAVTPSPPPPPPSAVRRPPARAYLYQSIKRGRPRSQLPAEILPSSYLL